MSKQPISAGCLAEVVNGLNGEKSPNIGLIVKVKSFVGEHSKHGRIWRCEAEFGELGKENFTDKVDPGHLDFAQDWLRRIDPPEGNKAKTVEKEIEHA